MPGLAPIAGQAILEAAWARAGIVTKIPANMVIRTGQQIIER